MIFKMTLKQTLIEFIKTYLKTTFASILLKPIVSFIYILQTLNLIIT